VRVIKRRKYLILIVTLAMVWIVQSFGRGVAFGPVVSDMVVIVSMLAVLAVVFKGWGQRVASLAAALALIAVHWSPSTLGPSEDLALRDAAHHGLLLLLPAFAVAVILRNIFAEEAITADQVLGAACGYLLTAVAWGHVYALVEILVPGSFSVAPDLARELSSRHGRTALFTYFSLATLTTMGYGDITPARPPATALAALEAIFGQFYIAVVVAQLVGLRLARAVAPKDPPSP
jgi:Ion channel